jgi:hypothetical protein
MESNFFNVDNWPLIYVKNKVGYLNDELIEEYQKDFLKILIRCKNNKEKIILLMDIYEKSNVQMNYIQTFISFHKKTEDYNRIYIEHIYILCESKILKNILSMFISNENTIIPCKIIRSLSKLRESFLNNHSKSIEDFGIYKTLENVMIEGN